MHQHTVRGMLYSLLIGALMAAGVIYTAPYAKASPDEDYIYYSLLENNGFHVTSPQIMRNNGLRVCSELQSGVTWRIVMTKIMTEADYDIDSASTILAAAVIAYCPDMRPAEMMEGEVA